MSFDARLGQRQSVRISVAVNGCCPDGEADIYCRMHEDVVIDRVRLENFHFQNLPSVGFDLLTLAGVVAFADRKVQRRLSKGWQRSFHIRLPVCDLERWRQPSVARTLVDALHFVSGDDWRFEFVHAGARQDLPRQGRLDMPKDPGEIVVIPYSNGLDSFALWQTLRHQTPKVSPIRVTAWNSAVSSAGRKKKGAELHAKIPVRLHGLKNPEPSFRTRTFLYKVLAALAADLAGATRVIIPENGQGAIGPSLVPFGCEWPHRSSHPGFTARLTAFLEALLGRRIVFEHPNLPLTKGQVLRQLQEAGLMDGWRETRSCVRDSRYSSLPGVGRVHCGVCSGCLLRRTSLLAANIGDHGEPYLWPDLSAADLKRAMAPEAVRETGPNDRDIAYNAVLAMQALADFGRREPNSAAIRMAAFELANGSREEMDCTAQWLVPMLIAHGAEWSAFAESMGPHSWIHSVIGSRGL